MMETHRFYGAERRLVGRGVPRVLRLRSSPKPMRSHAVYGVSNTICSCGRHIHTKSKSRSSRRLPHKTSTPTDLQMQIPKLRRPQWKDSNALGSEVKPIQPKPRKKTATWDILCLMDRLQLPVPADMYTSILEECTDSRDATRAAKVHDHIIKNGLRPGLLLSNRLLLMYAACGHLDGARKFFNGMAVKDSISWAIMMAAYVDDYDNDEAIRLFVKMRHYISSLEFELSRLIILIILKGCVLTKWGFELGTQVHGWLLKVGFAVDLFLGTSLIELYVNFRRLGDARSVFDQMPHRDTVVWTIMIVGYCREDNVDKALCVFMEMAKAGTRKNSFTISTVLGACGRMNDSGRCGSQIHASAIKIGVVSDLFVRSSLIHMYAKSGLMSDAIKVNTDKRSATNNMTTYVGTPSLRPMYNLAQVLQ